MTKCICWYLTTHSVAAFDIWLVCILDMVALFVWTPVVWHWAGTCLGMAILCKHTRNTETRVYKYRYADVRSVLRWDIYVNIHHQLSKLGASYSTNPLTKTLVEGKDRWLFIAVV